MRKHKKQMTPEEIEKRRRRVWADFRLFIQRLLVLGLFIYLLFFQVMGVAMVPNDDMKPKLYGGDLVLYYRLQREWFAQDLMYYSKDGKNYIGRVVAAAGDRVEITEDGRVIVNDNALLEDEIFYANKIYEAGIDFPITLGPDEFFVLGDYREGAQDSRLFGPVSKKEIKGKIITGIRRKGL